MDREEFILEVEKLGIEVDEKKLEQLDLFYKLLLEWNEKINLTTIVLEKDVYLKHFYDSLTLYRDIPLKENITICDVGTGAGFPGIVLKIFFPNLKITLIDSLNKRIIYLNDVINRLGLHNIEAYHYRMEEYSRLNEEKYDYVTARAVSQLPILCEICCRAVKKEGKLVFMKANCEDECIDLDKKVKKLGLVFEYVDKFTLPFENSNRSIVVLKKICQTNNLYPRMIDKIKKNPL